MEGSVFISGAAVQWLRDGLGLIRAAEETEALAASVEDTGGVYFVPAFAGLGAPYWNPYARMMFNYIRADNTYSNAAGVNALTDIIALRWQVDF